METKGQRNKIKVIGLKILEEQMIAVTPRH